MVANLSVVAEIILFTWSVVGIIGVVRFHLNFGLSHLRPLALVNHSYARANEHLLEFDSFEYPIAFLASSGFIRSATLLSSISLCLKALIVFLAFPSIVAFSMVLSICSWYRVSGWGRRIASDGDCIVYWSTVTLSGLVYQPGALAILGSNPSDPTNGVLCEIKLV